MGVEAVARIGGKGLDMGHVPGGIPEVTMEELMGALAGLEKGPELLLRASVIKQPVLEELYREAFHVAVTLAVKHGWKPQKGRPILRGMGRLAVNEIVDPASVLCKTCQGTGLVADQTGNATVQCSSCGGTGRKQPKVNFSAAICGIDEKTWRNKWADRYPKVQDEIRNWYELACRHVNKQLRG